MNERDRERERERQTEAKKKLEIRKLTSHNISSALDDDDDDDDATPSFLGVIAAVSVHLGGGSGWRT